jgi:hypothetical protein
MNPMAKTKPAQMRDKRFKVNKVPEVGDTNADFGFWTIENTSKDGSSPGILGGVLSQNSLSLCLKSF